MVESRKIRILLVDGGIMQEALHALLERQSDLEIAGRSCGAEISQALEALWPDVTVVNLITPGASGVEIIRQVYQQRPEVRVIVLSAVSHRFFAEEVLRAGIRGYVTLHSALDELLEAIRAVAAGQTYVCSEIRREILAQYVRADSDDRHTSEMQLTERERVILRCLGDGQTSKEIARAQNLSSKTIDACRRRLMQKLRVDSMAGLVKYAILMEMTAVAPLTPQ